MKQEFRSLVRKIIYAVLMAVLLLPIAAVSRPATSNSAGGELAKLRKQYQLSPLNLGEIDPTSQTLRLATLGMSGIAANILWGQATYYKKVEDWTSFAAALDQITKIQPNFIAVWRFQAWNLSYNVSAEFDDYKDRYYWVKQGIEYLKRGTIYNGDNPRLLWDVGWFFGHKIGRSDEHRQFRRLFKMDEDFKPELPNAPDFDNWLVGKKYYVMAQDAVRQGHSLRGMSPLVFNADAPMSQINYSAAINEDGVFGERSRDSWQRAYDDWYDFGSMNIPTSYGFFIQLNTLEELDKEFQEQKDAFDALLPGVAVRLSQEKRADLTEEEIDAMSTPFGERTGEQFTKAALGEEKLKVTYTETAYAAPDHLRTQAIKMADDLNAIEERLKAVDRYRQVVNFENWRMRCELEKTDDALLAHQFIYDGNTAFDQGDLAGAEENYVQGMAYWRKVLDQFPGIIEDRDTGEDLAKVIANYRAILDQNDKKFPDPFVLQDILDRYGDSSN